MATLKKILEAARLIERSDTHVETNSAAAASDDADLDALIRRAAAADARPDSGPEAVSSSSIDSVSSASSVSAVTASIEEGLGFADIYARQSVADAQFPVERLLKLVDGLRTLDPATRRAAITAMDIADETWSMDQVLADADAKIAALRGHQRGLKSTADGIVSANLQRVAAFESSRDSSVAELRKQITALEAQIQDALGGTAAEVAKLQSESESSKAALQRETQRIDAHILNLEELAAQFRPPSR